MHAIEALTGQSLTQIAKPPGRIAMASIYTHPALIRRPATLCQLAGVYRGKLADPAGTWAEPKVDGVRACLIDGQLVSGREGVPMHGVDHIVEQLQCIEAAAGEPLFIDGEYQVDGDYQATMRHMGHRAGAATEGVLWVFDAVPMARWHTDDDDRALWARKAALRTLFEAAADRDDAWQWQAGSHGRTIETVRLMPDEWLADHAAVMRRAAAIWAAGGEGLVLKDAESPYRRERSNAWRKVKQSGWSTRQLKAA